ncbi:MAG: hypothetical protein U5N85_04295 [Arcicella sp.]|nr:hypothetical protein [Arcicella sp.]
MVPSVDGLSLGGNHFEPGTFKLEERNNRTYKLVWQYYVIGENGVSKSRTPASRKFTKWNQAPDYDIANGDEIIWRLVAIYKAQYKAK